MEPLLIIVHPPFIIFRELFSHFSATIRRYSTSTQQLFSNYSPLFAAIQ